MYVSVGVDVGQLRDHSAVAIVESQKRYTGEVHTRVRLNSSGFPIEVEEKESATYYEVRDAIRLPLNTPYKKVGKVIADAVGGLLKMDPDRFVTVTVDVTGLGGPVQELAIGPALEPLMRHVALHSATFTHGDKLGADAGYLSVGKYYLVTRLKALFQNEQLALPKGHRELELMMEELMDFDREIDEDANERYGAFRVGSHDDLVTALGLAVLDDMPGMMPQVFQLNPR